MMRDFLFFKVIPVLLTIATLLFLLSLVSQIYVMVR
jgi:hypothetical protein